MRVTTKLTARGQTKLIVRMIKLCQTSITAMLQTASKYSLSLRRTKLATTGSPLVIILTSVVEAQHLIFGGNDFLFAGGGNYIREYKNIIDVYFACMGGNLIISSRLFFNPGCRGLPE